MVQYCLNCGQELEDEEGNVCFYCSILGELVLEKRKRCKPKSERLKQMKDYREKHKDEINKNARDYYAKNISEISEKRVEMKTKYKDLYRDRKESELGGTYLTEFIKKDKSGNPDFDKELKAVAYEKRRIEKGKKKSLTDEDFKIIENRRFWRHTSATMYE